MAPLAPPHARLRTLAPPARPDPHAASGAAATAADQTAHGTNAGASASGSAGRTAAFAFGVGVGVGVAVGVGVSIAAGLGGDRQASTPALQLRHGPDTELDLYQTALRNLFLRGPPTPAAPPAAAPAQQHPHADPAADGCAGQPGRHSWSLGRLATADSPNAAGFIADAVERAIDSVVNISVETDASTLFERKTLVSSGSGFFVGEDGMILTNAHVVGDMSEDSRLWVTAADGSRFPGSVHSLDHISDLAIVRVHGTPASGRWPVAQFGTNKNLRPGDWVVAIGSPFGLQNTVTAGIVSSRRRRSAEIGARDSRVEYIQTDCVVHSGSSGGPLINLDGHVVGINTTRAESEGISFAIRIDNAKEMIRQLVLDGRVTRPWLGIRMVTLSPNVRAQLHHQEREQASRRPDASLPPPTPQMQQQVDQIQQHLTKHHNSAGAWSAVHKLPDVAAGVLVTGIEAKSPASASGLLEGDVIVSVDGKPVASASDLLKHIGLGVGETFALGLRRSVATEVDWDGRALRFADEDCVVRVTPATLDVFMQGDGQGDIL
ncbi:Serine protease htra3 [Polyrhizophydium stewartii]|uniref:Serine protease htra3 n=1 Tax=Polyrhizophydium stewartii TaxID=2732419 RepID=A0ABR4NI77_9FUNG